MAKKTISPGGSVSGVVELSGDKSISHRYAILAALAEGTSEIRNYSPAADCASTLECVRRLGIAVDAKGEHVRIAGKGLDGLKAPRRTIDAENSGSTIRMMSGVLAGQSFTATLTGDSSLRRRPMRRVVDPLRQMGAEIRSSDGDRAPLEIRGGKLQAIDYTPPVPSAQVKSAILLAGLYTDGVTSVREAVRTRDHTEVALREFGANVLMAKGEVRIEPRPKLQPRQLIVPGDLSSADFLISIGAAINLASVQLRDGELIGDVSVRRAPLIGGSISGAQVAEMIDELPMLAALGPFTEKGIEIHDAQELRVKESDRIAALAEGLRQMGARVEEF